jgi:glutamine amidotransferase
MRVGVIDYGVGNLGSVMRALEELRVKAILIDRAVDMHSADSLILPGVGNFSDCMGLLKIGGFTEALAQEVKGYGRPLLGICVGMQMLADLSTEGAAIHQETSGLGFIPGRVEHVRILGCSLRVPHVGWNAITRVGAPDPLLDGLPDGTDFYFVHSYAFVPREPADVLATADYGVPLTAAVRRGHVWGTQFHPEKSSRAGFQLLRNFIQNSAC